MVEHVFTGNITYEGSLPDASMVDAAKRIAEDLRRLKLTSGQSRLVRGEDLPDGSQVYVVDYEHVWKVHIIPAANQWEPQYPLEKPPVEPFGAVEGIAGFVSGTTTSTIMDYKNILWQYPDYPDAPPPEQTYPVARLIGGQLTQESAKLFTTDEAGLKLAVPPPAGFTVSGDYTPRHQMHTIRPGHYTGAMAPLVQLLLGVGFQVPPDYEYRWIQQKRGRSQVYVSPEPVYDPYGEIERYDVETTETVFRLGQARQITYDPRWNRTHGVMWGTTNEGSQMPLLVECAQRGLHVMQFPVDPRSKHRKIQDQYKKVYPALERYTPFKGGTQTLFEAFDGFPTGQGIPRTTEELDRAVRAGMVVRDDYVMDEVYQGTNAICTFHGWAFHPTAPRAMLVGYRMDGHRKLGVCYEVTLQVSEKAEIAKVRNPLSEELIEALGLTTDVDKFKAERVPGNIAEQMIRGQDYDAFDAFSVDADFTVQANVVLVRSGYLDYTNSYQCNRLDPCKPIGSPHFKYYEPLIGMTVDFWFENGAMRDADEEATSDGPIFCTYTSKGAEILNFACRPIKVEREEGTTRQYCQYEGQWEEFSRHKRNEMAGYFYSTSKDFRKMIARDGGRTRKVTGYRTGHYDFMSFCAFFATHSTMRRHYKGYETYTEVQLGGYDYDAAVICAAYDRSAFFVCVEERESEKIERAGMTNERTIGGSGTISYGYLYQFHLHWTGVCRPDGWEQCYGDPVCKMVVCLTVEGEDPCFGSDPPVDPGYSVCPPGSRLKEGESPSSTFDGKTTNNMAAVYSAAYNGVPTRLQGWSWSSTPQWVFRYQIWGMGLDLMNGLLLDEGEETIDDPKLLPLRLSDLNWWNCSDPNCPTPPYYMAANYYGVQCVSTYTSIGMWDSKHIGAKPYVPFGPMTIPFGIVE